MTDDTQTQIEKQQLEPQPQPVQVREGWWRMRNGNICHVTRTPDDHELAGPYPWWNAINRCTWRNDGRYTHDRESVFDLLDDLGPNEPKLQPVQAPQAESNAKQQVKLLKNANDAHAETIKRLQGLLGDAKRQIVQLDKLVADLRTVNMATENAMNAAITAGDQAKKAIIDNIENAVWTMFQTNLDHLVSILAKLHLPNGTLTPDFYCFVVQTIATRCNEMIQNVSSQNNQPSENDEIPPVVFHDCILDNALVQVR